MKKYGSSVSVLFALLASSFAVAGPWVDPALTKLMDARSASQSINETKDAQLITVIALFKNAPELPSGRLGRRTHAAVQKAMMKANTANIAKFKTALSSMRLANVAVTTDGMSVKPLWIANGATIKLTVDQLALLKQSSDLSAIYSNQKVSLIKPTSNRPAQGPGVRETYTYGLEKLGIPALRTTYPAVTGTGVRVGLIDTGVDATHPDLVNKVVGFRDFINNRTVAYDDNGHGTHCSGTILGGNTSGQSIGVAPGAQLIAAKFLSSTGAGSFEGALAAMQYMADPDGNPATADFPVLVSNSWGGSAPSATQDPAEQPLCRAVTNWVRLGIMPVFAAGNSGPTGAVGLPGGCPDAITIGATDATDTLAPFSSRGPATWKTGSFIKPDVSAPGVNINSAAPGGGYRQLSGTSMATPHVAGMTALLYQLRPTATVAEMSALIQRTSLDLGAPGKDNMFGMGRVDALAAVTALSTPPVVPPAPPAPVPPAPLALY